MLIEAEKSVKLNCLKILHYVYMHKWINAKVNPTMNYTGNLNDTYSRVLKANKT